MPCNVKLKCCAGYARAVATMIVCAKRPTNSRNCGALNLRRGWRVACFGWWMTGAKRNTLHLLLCAMPLEGQEAPG